MAAPELRLNVTLDLAAFRAQLGKLAQTSASHLYPVKLTIDQRNFKLQLAQLSKIKPVININDAQLEGARRRIGTLNKSLATLRRATATPIEIKLKYVEVGKPPSAAAGQIGNVVSGRVRADQAVAALNREQAVAARNMLKAANVPVGDLGTGRSLDAYRKSITEGMAKAGKESIAGLAQGLKNGQSAIGQAAKTVGDEGVRAIKDTLGIASPSRVFKQIGEFSVDGLEIGFLNGLKDFKTKAVGGIKSIVKSLQQEARVGMIAVGGLLSPVARPGTAATRTIPGVPSPRDVVSNRDPGRSNNRILNSLSLLTGDPKLYRSRMANLGANRLPSSLLGSAATQMNLEEIAPSFKQARLGGAKTGVANIIDEAFFGRGTLPKAESALNGLSNTIERLASAARAAAPSGILQSASGNARMRPFGGVAPSESMGIFPPTARPASYPPSGGFLEFSRRATAISSGLPGNVFGGRAGSGAGGSSGGGGGGRGPGGGGVLPSKGFPADDIAITSTARLNTAMNVASASMKNFGASKLPLIGGLANLAGEFGEAAKQVLLYGTAYKGLAFITSLPGQILNAAKSQQQFNNSMQVATQDTGTFAKELVYIDNVQRAFGLNLESTRSGFMRLYASMAPAGFDSGSIEKLFTGMAAAAASLQLTPDKAERVTYAFSQIASKGQLMSEELKGQLGDVLPGALALFAKAAGKELGVFSKEVEDGVYKGQALRDILAKVSDELINRFGTGAQQAGKALQGLLNRVGGEFQRTLESFAPLADSAAQSILGPLSGALQDVGLAARLAFGEIAIVDKQIEQAKQTLSDAKVSGNVKGIRAAEQSLAAVEARSKSLNTAMKDPAIAEQAKNIKAFVDELGKAGQALKNIADTIGKVLGPMFMLLGTNLTASISVIASLVIGFGALKLAIGAGIAALSLLNAGIVTSGVRALVIAVATKLFNGLGVAITTANLATIGLKASLVALSAATVFGAIAAGVALVAGAFLTMRDRAKEAADASRDAIKEAGRAATTGNDILVTQQLNNELAKNRAVAQGLATLQEIYETNKDGMRMGQKPIISAAQMAVLDNAKDLSNEIAGIISGNQLKGDGFEISAFLGQDLDRVKRQAGQVSGEVKKSVAVIKEQQKIALANKKKMGLEVPTPDPLTDTSEEDKKKTSLESYHSLQDQLAKNFTQAEIDRLEAEHQHKIDLINAEYDLREAKANSFQKEALKFERRMVQIDMERQGALLKASNAVLAAQGSVAGGVTGGLSATGATGLLQGSTGVSSGAHFDIRRADGSFISPEQARALLDPAVRRQMTTTSAYGPRQAPVPGASTFHRGVDLAGPANTPLNLAPGYSMVGQGEEGGVGYAASVRGPQGEMYKVGHLQRPAAGAGAARKVPGSEKRDIVADQKTQLEQVKQSATARQSEEKALKDAEVALANFVAAATPVEEQKLQNSLLERRTDLMMQGYSDEAIDRALKFYEAEYNVNEGIAANKRLLDAKRITQSQSDENTKTMTKSLKDYSAALDENTIRLRNNQLAQAMTALKNRMTMATALTPDDKLRAQIKQDFPEETPEVRENLFQQEKITQAAEKTDADLQGIASSIGSSFGEAFKGIITGSMTVQQALAGMFQSIADSFADMAAQMIADFMRMQALNLLKTIFGAVAPAIGGGLGSGFSAGTSSAIDTGAGGWASSFATPLKFANGGIAPGSFQAFANGGMVTGPTLGLVGEGRYNEAIIPLPDGKSVPVQLSGSSGGNAAPINTSIVVNVKNGQAESQISGNQGNQLARELEGAVRQVILKESRPGGLISSSR